MAEWIADGFEANGHTIDRIDRKDIIINPESYDFILFADCSEDFSDRIPKCPDCLKVFWSMDSHMPGGAERSVNIARKCDLTFSSNYEHGVKILEKFGVESLLMPITYNDNLVKAFSNNKYSVAMIGHPNSEERKELWARLHAKYSDCFTGKAESKGEYINIMNRSLFVVNQPTEPWDMILNNRFFEAMAVGAALFQKRLKTDLIEKLGFVEHEHFIYWNTLDELLDKMGSTVITKQINNAQEKVQQYSMSAQCAKIESVILDKFYDRL